ncbi:DNA lyase, partial [Elusimicrobiota bacterium]
RKKNLLRGGSAEQISRYLNKVRFKNNKARYVVEARKLIKEVCSLLPPTRTLPHKEGGKYAREWLARNIKGIGYKEASHFLRNIGLGEEIAILDRHILKNLKRYGAIREIPGSITPKKYFEIEKKMIAFARTAKIPPAHLDLLFWANETGEIFK